MVIDVKLVVYTWLLWLLWLYMVTMVIMVIHGYYGYTWLYIVIDGLCTMSCSM